MSQCDRFYWINLDFFVCTTTDDHLTNGIIFKLIIHNKFRPKKKKKIHNKQFVSQCRQLFTWWRDVGHIGYSAASISATVTTPATGGKHMWPKAALTYLSLLSLHRLITLTLSKVNSFGSFCLIKKNIYHCRSGPTALDQSQIDSS